MRRRTALLAVLGVLAAAAPAGAAIRAKSVAPDPVVVAVIDTGLNAAHQEFDYRGADSTSDQLVGWWDFTTETKDAIGLPGPGQRWDTSVREPYDRHGHGTGTASMAVSHNVAAQKSASAHPGGKLAVAKVGNGDGVIQGDIAAAIRWATDSVGADVVNISIGTIVPIPASLQRSVYNAIRYARSKGVLVVVANGNGWGNLGVLPGDPGWANGFSSSTQALSVGASGATGLLVTTDPEVAAVFSVVVPAKEGRDGYRNTGGTSFSSPFVAGFAAALIHEARGAGRNLTADALEQLVKNSATDTSIPPPFEGYGVVSMAELAAAKAHARAGTLPGRPSPDVSGTYVEQFAGTLRSAWSD